MTPPPCGHLGRQQRMDALTGAVTYECDECDRLAMRAAQLERFDTAAFARVATIANMTVADVRRRLRIRAPKIPRPPNPDLPATRHYPKGRCVPTCVVCDEVLAWRGKGRPPKYCLLHIPKNLLYVAKRRGDLRLQPAHDAVSLCPAE